MKPAALALVFALSLVHGADKKQQRAWREGTVLRIENGFIPTGTSNSGQVDSDGSYSGRSRVTGDNVTEYLVQSGNVRMVLRANASARAHLYGIGVAKRKVPDLHIEGPIKFVLEKQSAYVLNPDGKEFKLMLIREWSTK